MRKRLIAGNWKLNGSLDFARELLSSIQVNLPFTHTGDVVVAPPAVWLATLHEQISHPCLSLAAQTVSEHAQGAYTGEISAAMLAEAGCRFVITGHSERRQLFAEDNAVVARKTRAVLDSGLSAIVCVGETLAERDQGNTWSVIVAQLAAVAEQCPVMGWQEVVIAYEPVWAIGTGKTASPEQAQEVHAQIRAWIAGRDTAIADGIRIVYGGSVKADNAASLMGQPDIDGALVGGASLSASEFLRIILS